MSYKQLTEGERYQIQRFLDLNRIGTKLWIERGLSRKVMGEALVALNGCLADESMPQETD